ncbi:PREDICTED: uncharacterized protein LOC108973602 [Bactrocera latifrons]|uniref:Beta-1,3-galactosyltransferase 1 n=1 Tax=Bactrocera latifrons TaxID=174628 RepID=A0A0K8URA8_BACLA|nr:PREDICTED: uncharacterized protein LOC108973602 [Bactrocera latifrons]XP_018796518.1 PREDICTED: uncharacterized protein LOC108973602 [Bactrocera latifrons]XP_018796519.1 PREDICTED: uncharacterized protein LOC108973602 [Bactrocera latifrons]XP_018796521.1 PREDICTED: uncharacterized protein LOC108973602 [Bactrocera latifrons]
MGSIHNIRFVRFLLVVSIVILTIFIYATYSSNATLTPPHSHSMRASSVTDVAGAIAQQYQPLIAANKSKFSNDAADGGFEKSNRLDAPRNEGDISLLKLNKKAAVMSGASTGSGAGVGKVPLASAAKKQHQHREPTIDVDAPNDEPPEDDEMERFGNELLEDMEVQNVDNALVVGSIGYPNASNGQPNNVGAPLEQPKSENQGQPDQLKSINAKSSDNANNINKILDSEVMIPTSNLQKFIENADKILKNITAAPAANEKSVTKDSNGGSKQLPEENAIPKVPKAEGNIADNENDDDDNDVNSDVALPPSVVMTIKRPDSAVKPQKPIENNALPKIIANKPKTSPKVPPKVVHPVPPKIIDHTKGIATSEIYESGHLNEEINFAKICPNEGEDLKLLILISSALNHAEARLAIRQTWAHYGTRRDVSIAFVLGRSTNESISKELSIENFIYGDMIRGNFIDSYTNLTLKTISTLEWVDVHCQKAKFILKTDDDMFINVPKLLQFIDSHIKDKRVIYGRLAKQWKPIRNKKSKYYVSTDQFSQPLFPPFTTGPAYLITSDVIHLLYERSLHQVYLKLEDVFTTGIVAQQVGIKRVHANEFLNRRIAFNPCNIRKLISVHMVKSNEQFDLWKKLLDKGTKCK